MPIRFLIINYTHRKDAETAEEIIF
jgi:hypothetical protein